jgi:hypothetical protein
MGALRGLPNLSSATLASYPFFAFPEAALSARLSGTFPGCCEDASRAAFLRFGIVLVARKGQPSMCQRDDADKSNGSRRRSYGRESLVAARRSRYRCQECGHADVRVLELDHVEGRVRAFAPTAIRSSRGARIGPVKNEIHPLRGAERVYFGRERSRIAARSARAFRERETRGIQETIPTTRGGC